MSIKAKVVAGLICVAGWANGAVAQTSPNAVDAIKAASAAFDDAQFRKDARAMDRFLAQDFKFVRGSGKLSDRTDFIAGFVDPDVSFDPFIITNRIYIELGPEAGIASGEGIIRGKDHGKSFQEHFRYADTFRRIGGRWQVVYIQVTPLEAP